jgi:hypothetical protein
LKHLIPVTMSVFEAPPVEARKHLPELYYEAGRLNDNVRGVLSYLNNTPIIETESGNHDYPSFISYFRTSTPKTVRELFGNDEISSGRQSKDRYLILQGSIYGNIKSFGEGIDLFFSHKQPQNQFLFAPQLIAFLALAPNFPDVAWGKLNDELKEIMEKFFHFSDDGPVPAFGKLDCEAEKKLGDYRDVHQEFAYAGRKLSLEIVTVDWCYSDEEIAQELKKHVNGLRTSRGGGTKVKLAQKSSYYRAMELGSTPAAMLSMLREIREIQNSQKKEWKGILETSTHDPALPFSSYKEPEGNAPKSRRAIRAGLSSIGIKLNEAKYTSGADHFDSFMHLMLTGFNLPSRSLRSSMDADKLCQTSVFTE